MNVSRETEEMLRLYAASLEKWTRKINLVAPSTIDRIWERHIEDSAQIADLVPDPAKWADLGSGAGLPGLVVAIVAKGRGAKTKVSLLESDRRKAAFCRTVVRDMDLRVEIVSERIEAAAPVGADVVSARALAPLSKLLGYAVRHQAPAGQCLFLKGENWKTEVEAARTSWHFSLDVVPSKTEPSAVILKIGDIDRV